MNYYIFAMVFTVVIITAFTTLTINAMGQISNSTMQEGLIFNNTENQQQQSEKQDQVLDKKIIKVSSTEFNELLDDIETSINYIHEKDYVLAESILGKAIVKILNYTQQYQELVQFASSQYDVNKIQQQQQFNDEEKENK